MSRTAFVGSLALTELILHDHIINVTEIQIVAMAQTNQRRVVQAIVLHPSLRVLMVSSAYQTFSNAIMEEETAGIILMKDPVFAVVTLTSSHVLNGAFEERIHVMEIVIALIAQMKMIVSLMSMAAQTNSSVVWTGADASDPGINVTGITTAQTARMNMRLSVVVTLTNSHVLTVNGAFEERIHVMEPAIALIAQMKTIVNLMSMAAQTNSSVVWTGANASDPSINVTGITTAQTARMKLRLSVTLKTPQKQTNRNAWTNNQQ